MRVKADHCPTRQEVPKPPTMSEMKPVSLSEVMNDHCDTQGIKEVQATSTEVAEMHFE